MNKVGSKQDVAAKGIKCSKSRNRKYSFVHSAFGPCIQMDVVVCKEQDGDGFFVLGEGDWAVLPFVFTSAWRGNDLFDLPSRRFLAHSPSSQGSPNPGSTILFNIWRYLSADDHELDMSLPWLVFVSILSTTYLKGFSTMKNRLGF